MFTRGGTKTQSGFTVIEVLIGIGIFAVVMPAIIVAVVNVAGLNDKAADLTRANIVAEDKIESLRSAGYNTLAVGSTVTFTNELDLSFTEPRQASYTISQPIAGYKEIDLNIQYTHQGVERKLNYKTIISELGVSQ